MPSESWMTSIQPQATSSGGLSPHLFDSPSNLRTLLLTDDWGDVEVGFHTYVATSGSAFSIFNYSTGQEAAKRLLGSLILQNMPSPGVDEAFISLVDAYEFHYHNLAPLMPPPLSTRHGVGILAGQSARPPLTLEE